MTGHGIIQGTVYRSSSGAVYDIKGSFLTEDSIECPGCRADAPIRVVRETGRCPGCGGSL